MCSLTKAVFAALCVTLAAAGAVHAKTFQLATDNATNWDADLRFNALCEGPDSFNCEYTVAELRAGDRGPSAGESELVIYNRLDFVNAVAGAKAEASPFDTTTQFLISYRDSGSLTLSGFGNTTTFNIDFGQISAKPNNPTEAPQTVVIRVRAMRR